MMGVRQFLYNNMIGTGFLVRNEAIEAKDRQESKQDWQERKQDAEEDDLARSMQNCRITSEEYNALMRNDILHWHTNKLTTPWSDIKPNNPQLLPVADQQQPQQLKKKKRQRWVQSVMVFKYDGLASQFVVMDSVVVKFGEPDKKNSNLYKVLISVHCRAVQQIIDRIERRLQLGDRMSLRHFVEGAQYTTMCFMVPNAGVVAGADKQRHVYKTTIKELVSAGMQKGFAKATMGFKLKKFVFQYAGHSEMELDTSWLNGQWVLEPWQNECALSEVPRYRWVEGSVCGLRFNV